MTPEKTPTVFAEGGNRAAALFVDWAVLTALFVTLSQLATSIPGAELAARLALPVAFLLYFGAFPLTPLRGTPGKWICRLRLCDRRGRALAWPRSFARAAATLGWFALAAWVISNATQWGWGYLALSLVWVVFLAAWLPTAFRPRGESAFDLLAGTLVVRLRAAPDAISDPDAGRKPSVTNAVVAVVLCGLAGSCTGTAMRASHEMNLRARIAYAIETTRPLREKLQAFRDQEHRWPTPAELGVPEWQPYPDGGGYRLQPDGIIVIGFSVLPELKGRTLSLTPEPDATGKHAWKCSADPGIDRAYLYAACR